MKKDKKHKKHSVLEKKEDQFKDVFNNYIDYNKIDTKSFLLPVKPRKYDRSLSTVYALDNPLSDIIKTKTNKPKAKIGRPRKKVNPVRKKVKGVTPRKRRRSNTRHRLMNSIPSHYANVHKRQVKLAQANRDGMKDEVSRIINMLLNSESTYYVAAMKRVHPRYTYNTYGSKTPTKRKKKKHVRDVIEVVKKVFTNPIPSEAYMNRKEDYWGVKVKNFYKLTRKVKDPILDKVMVVPGPVATVRHKVLNRVLEPLIQEVYEPHSYYRPNRGMKQLALSIHERLKDDVMHIHRIVLNHQNFNEANQCVMDKIEVLTNSHPAICSIVDGRRSRRDKTKGYNVQEVGKAIWYPIEGSVSLAESYGISLTHHICSLSQYRWNRVVIDRFNSFHSPFIDPSELEYVHPFLSELDGVMFRKYFTYYRYGDMIIFISNRTTTKDFDDFTKKYHKYIGDNMDLKYYVHDMNSLFNQLPRILHNVGRTYLNAVPDGTSRYTYKTPEKLNVHEMKEAYRSTSDEKVEEIEDNTITGFNRLGYYYRMPYVSAPNYYTTNPERDISCRAHARVLEFTKDIKENNTLSKKAKKWAWSRVMRGFVIHYQGICGYFINLKHYEHHFIVGKYNRYLGLVTEDQNVDMMYLETLKKHEELDRNTREEIFGKELAYRYKGVHHHDAIDDMIKYLKLQATAFQKDIALVEEDTDINDQDAIEYSLLPANRITVSKWPFKAFTYKKVHVVDDTGGREVSQFCRISLNDHLKVISFPIQKMNEPSERKRNLKEIKPTLPSIFKVNKIKDDDNLTSL